MSALMTLRLGALLGPFGDRVARVAGLKVSRTELTVDVGGGRRFRMWVFAPRRPRGLLLVAPGLHPAGPADPRMREFLNALAAAGILVAAPHLPDLCALRLAPTLTTDFMAAYRVFVRYAAPLGLGRVGLFSISFGSLPALRLASDPEFAQAVSGVVTFGGYADWRSTMRFSLTGESSEPGQSVRPYDPLNRPVIFMNLLDGMDSDVAPPGFHELLREAWRSYVERTWGRPEMKARSRFEPVAREIARTLPRRIADTFLVGTGVSPGGLELALDALSRADLGDFLDPRPGMLGLRSPLHLIHSAGDDVIPPIEMRRLARAAPREVQVRQHLTGLYSHTRAADGVGPRAALKEARTMLGMLGGIASVASG